MKQGPKKRLPRKITESYLRNAGLFYLQRFTTSSANFRAVMSRKIKRSCNAYPEQSYDESLALLDPIVADFCEKGYLNDDLYAKSLTTTLQRKGLSKRLIQQKLQQKGVAHAAFENNDYECALRLLQRRKLGPFSQELDEKQLKRAYGVLGRAGFDYAVCKKAIDTTVTEAEEFLQSVSP